MSTVNSKAPPNKICVFPDGTWHVNPHERCVGSIPFVPEKLITEASYAIVKEILDGAEKISEEFQFEAAIATSFIEWSSPIIEAVVKARKESANG